MSYTHLGAWRDSLLKGHRVLISKAESNKEAESEATVTSVGAKYITVEIPGAMAGASFGSTLRFSKITGQQVGHHKWIKNRILMRFTEKRWRKIKSTRGEIDLCRRGAQAMYNRDIPPDRLKTLVEELESYPVVSGEKIKRLTAYRTR